MNDISFKSKINFVSPETFKKVANGKVISENGSIICGNDLQTHAIRNCTGILAIGKYGATGVHYYPNDGLLLMLEDQGNFMSAVWKNFFRFQQKAFLIGSKRVNYNDISVKIFKELKNLYNENLKDENLTFFEEHTHLHSESDFAYNYDDDTLTVCTKFNKLEDVRKSNKNPKIYYVSNAEDLLRCFKKIKISDKDILCFEDKPFDFKKYYNFGRILKQRLNYVKELCTRKMHKYERIGNTEVIKDIQDEINGLAF
ncbi:MAG: hypothetical protein MJ237_01870 [bacterium]|nr:hypothetical protein [bacterium]